MLIDDPIPAETLIFLLQPATPGANPVPPDGAPSRQSKPRSPAMPPDRRHERDLLVTKR
jgi:hypothetical protein